MSYLLPDLNLLKVKSTIFPKENSGEFVIEPLSPGYGVTIGNTLRRILLASLEGAAIKSVKISGVSHEYSTIKGMKEDVIDLILNLKTSRFKLLADSSAKIELSVKGPKKVRVSDFKKVSEVKVINPDHYLATLDKGGKLELEVEIDKGRGYVPVEKKVVSKAPIGTISIDSIYTPVKKVKYETVNTRVGEETNYDRLTLNITTDGSITSAEALWTAAEIMGEHVQVIAEACRTKKLARGESKNKKKQTKEKSNKIKKTSIKKRNK